MPNGIFPIPQFRDAPTPGARPRPSMVTRLRTRRRRNELDRQLAGGADPESSAALGLRAAQLSSADGRSRLANALVETLGDARGPNLGAFGMKTRGRHAAIRDATDDLEALVQRLRGDQPIEIRGAAMAARLVDDRGSVLHRGSGQDLEDALRAARSALDTADPVSPILAAAA